MRSKRKLIWGIFVIALALFCASLAVGQQKPATVPQVNITYDITHEAVVQGTVTSYTATSDVPPVGPRATIQTAAGVVDVHLGNANFMKQNDLFLAPGDSVKIVGESKNLGGKNVFLARIVQKGSQTVTLRNLNGIPYVAKAAANAKPRSIFGGAQ